MSALSSPQNQRPQSRQDRSRHTEQVLLDAALQLFRERGFETITVGDIASRAGVAPASIYRRFGDKEGLLREAYRHFISHALGMLETMPTSTPQERSYVERLALVTSLVMRYSHANQHLLQSSFARALVDDYYATALRELRAGVLAALKRHFLERVHEIHHPEPELAVDFALRQAVAMLSARLEAGQLEVGTGAIPEPVFLRELMRSILGYLQISFSSAEVDAALRRHGL
ncbi:MAG: TetR/AcrR family transcriptional regulator [Moraxellaceae bacterium]